MDTQRPPERGEKMRTPFFRADRGGGVRGQGGDYVARWVWVPSPLRASRSNLPAAVVGPRERKVISFSGRARDGGDCGGPFLRPAYLVLQEREALGFPTGLPLRRSPVG